MLLHFITWAHSKDKVETVAEMDAVRSFGMVVEDIWSGQVEDVFRVVSFDPATGIGSDVTKAVAEALCAKSHADENEPYYELEPFMRKFGFEPYQEPYRRDQFGDRADAAYEAKIAA